MLGNKLQGESGVTSISSMFGGAGLDGWYPSDWYNSLTWVYRCTRIRAENLAGVGWDIVDADGQSVPEEHPFRALLTYVNEDETFEELIAATESWLSLRGNAFWELASANPQTPLGPTNPPLALYILRPDKLVVRRNPVTGAREYQFRNPASLQTLRKDQVFHVKHFSTQSRLTGTSPLTALRETLQTDVNALRWNKNFFKNAAMPALFMSPTNDDLTPEQVKVIQEQMRSLYLGVEKAHRTAVMPTKMTLDTLGVSSKDAEFLGLRQVSKEEVCAAFGVPLPIAGDIGKAQYNNISRAEKIFWAETLVPEMRLLRGTLNKQLGKFFPGAYFTWDYSTIEALQEDATIRQERVLDKNMFFLNMFQAGALSVPEFRELVNQSLPELGVQDIDLAAELEVPALAPIDVVSRPPFVDM